MRSFCPLDLLSAHTVRIPLTSMSKVTLIFGLRAGEGAMPVISKLPRWWLSATFARSPSYTLMRTSDWLSTAVENTFSARVGMVVLRGMSVVMIPPAVCSPSDKGVTSRSTRSRIRSSISCAGSSDGHKRAACTAAPIATASSGLIPWQRGLPEKNSDSLACTAGTRVDPPTRTMSFTCSAVIPASSSTCCTGFITLPSKSSMRLSKTSLVMVVDRFSPLYSASTSTVVVTLRLRALLAFSAAVLSLLMARGSACMAARSIPCCWANVLARWPTSRSSKSSPPR
eukprot:scaffold175495_cov37-Prasinocladus_malaysianus.AAC.1